MNYCSGCHSLRYMRYNRIAKDLGLTTSGKKVDATLLSNLIFTSAKISDPVRIAMPKTDATKWFGLMPPDLSLSARERGPVWIYRFLTEYYPDKTRPFGTNNRLVPDTAMPDVLYPLKGLNQDEYKKNLDDLLTFLVYVGEPIKILRFQIGWFVIVFLGIFSIVAYFLKQIYWKKIAKVFFYPQNKNL
ncbi:MAG: cytochrome c1 [Tatlockia sp.]|nr:cytochrome c1 [Tatlockia sp.]